MEKREKISKLRETWFMQKKFGLKNAVEENLQIFPKALRLVSVLKSVSFPGSISTNSKQFLPVIENNFFLLAMREKNHQNLGDSTLPTASQGSLNTKNAQLSFQHDGKINFI